MAPGCNKPLVRKPGEGPRWRDRDVCDRACETARRRARAIERANARTECAVCGRPIKPGFDGRGRFKSPETCRQRDCLAELKRRTWAAKQAERAAKKHTTDPAVLLFRRELAKREKRKAAEKAVIHAKVQEVLARQPTMRETMGIMAPKVENAA